MFNGLIFKSLCHFQDRYALAYGQKKTAPKGGCERCMQGIELIINQFDIHGVETLAALFELETYTVVFIDLVDEPSSVHEIFSAAVLLPDETKTFGLVEELYNSFIHVKKI